MQQRYWGYDNQGSYICSSPDLEWVLDQGPTHIYKAAAVAVMCNDGEGRDFYVGLMPAPDGEWVRVGNREKDPTIPPLKAGCRW